MTQILPGRMMFLNDSGQAFPHIYGPLNLDAVIKAAPFPADANSFFTLPAL